MKYIFVCSLVVALVFLGQSALSIQEVPDTKLETRSAPESVDLYCNFQGDNSYELCIPKINVAGRILPYNGTNLSGINTLLKEGIVWLQNGAMLGELGNVVLFGHSSDYPWDRGRYKDIFANIHALQEGDMIFVVSKQETYKYVVKNSRVVSARDLSVLQNNSNKKTLTLITCWPKGTSLKRFVAIAELAES